MRTPSTSPVTVAAADQFPTVRMIARKAAWAGICFVLGNADLKFCHSRSPLLSAKMAKNVATSPTVARLPSTPRPVTAALLTPPSTVPTIDCNSPSASCRPACSMPTCDCSNQRTTSSTAPVIALTMDGIESTSSDSTKVSSRAKTLMKAATLTRAASTCGTLWSRNQRTIGQSSATWAKPISTAAAMNWTCSPIQMTAAVARPTASSRTAMIASSRRNEVGARLGSAPVMLPGLVSELGAVLQGGRYARYLSGDVLSGEAELGQQRCSLAVGEEHRRDPVLPHGCGDIAVPQQLGHHRADTAASVVVLHADHEPVLVGEPCQLLRDRKSVV